MSEQQPPFSATEYTEGDLFNVHAGARSILRDSIIRFDNLNDPQVTYRTISGAHFNQVRPPKHPQQLADRLPFQFDTYVKHLQMLHENGVSIPPLAYQKESLGGVAIRAAYISSQFTHAYDAIRDRADEPYQQMTTVVLPGLKRYMEQCRQEQSPIVLNRLFRLWQYRYGTIAGETPETAAAARWWLVDVEASAAPISFAKPFPWEFKKMEVDIEANTSKKASERNTNVLGATEYL